MSKKKGATAVEEALDTLPTVGDVDVADVDPGSGKGEVGPLILAGYWVVLGVDDDVPEEHEGKLAAVISSPWTSTPVGMPHSGIIGYQYDKAGRFIVKLRDETNATLEVSRSAFSRIGQMRADVSR